MRSARQRASRLAAPIRLPLETVALGMVLLLVVTEHPRAQAGSLAAPATASSWLLAAVALVSAIRVARASASNSGRHAAIRGALLGLLALNEELLWRGVLLCELLRWGVAAAWAASSVAFALGHGSRAGLHLVTGSAFGGIYLTTGALSACVCAHWAYNLVVDHAVRARPRG